jgi:hypothetical protein
MVANGEVKDMAIQMTRRTFDDCPVRLCTGSQSLIDVRAIIKDWGQFSVGLTELQGTSRGLGLQDCEKKHRFMRTI